MPMTSRPMTGFRRILRLSSIFVISTALTLPGCRGVNQMVRQVAPGAVESDRAIDSFVGKDIDYQAITEKHEEVRKITAMNGYGIVEGPDGPLTQYLNGILHRIIAVSPVPQVPAKVVVVDSQYSPVASAFQDGTIQIPFKLLADMDNLDDASEDALAFLLAHELSHILYYHYTSDVLASLSSGAVVLFELAHEVAQALGEVTGKSVVDSEKAESIYRKLLMANYAEQTVITPGWTRGQEDEADLLAFDLMIEAGYNPDGVYEFIDILHAYEKKAKQRDADRETEAGKKIAELANEGDIGGAVEKFVDSVITSLTRTASRAHASTDERRQSLIEYQERWHDEIAGAEDIDITALGWKAESTSASLDDEEIAQIRTVFRNYEAARITWEASDASERQSAVADVQVFLSGPTEYSPFPRVVAAVHSEERGKPDLALQHLQIALEHGAGPSFQIYEQLLHRLMTHRNYPRMHSVLDKAERQFGSLLRSMQWRAAVLDREGKHDEAEKVRGNCYNQNITYLKVRHLCTETIQL